jgi:8-oxo-dGTP pyrophosphatase MutT (NUDIX family)
VPITSDQIRDTIADYLNGYPAETARLAPVIDLLDTGADLASRKEFRGHATAGAVLTDELGRVLHIHHRALNRWLLPGGHIEAGDTGFLAAAIRELSEETGMPTSAVAPVALRPVHIDIHPIPANEAKGEPAHQHIDFRFHLHTTGDVVELQTEEVTDAAWLNPDSIADETLRTRITQSIRATLH